MGENVFWNNASDARQVPGDHRVSLRAHACRRGWTGMRCRVVVALVAAVAGGLADVPGGSPMRPVICVNSIRNTPHRADGPRPGLSAASRISCTATRKWECERESSSSNHQYAVSGGSICATLASQPPAGSDSFSLLFLSICLPIYLFSHISPCQLKNACGHELPSSCHLAARIRIQ